jgi:hypothetical protein
MSLNYDERVIIRSLHNEGVSSDESTQRFQTQVALTAAKHRTVQSGIAFLIC